jgi:hypothetical protein
MAAAEGAVSYRSGDTRTVSFTPDLIAQLVLPAHAIRINGGELRCACGEVFRGRAGKAPVTLAVGHARAAARRRWHELQINHINGPTSTREVAGRLGKAYGATRAYLRRCEQKGIVRRVRAPRIAGMGAQSTVFWERVNGGAR